MVRIVFVPRGRKKSLLGKIRKYFTSCLPLCRTGSATPFCVSRLHPGSRSLQPAGLLSSLTEPLSENLALQVTLGTFLKLHGRTTEFPLLDFNRQVNRFTRHTRPIRKTIPPAKSLFPKEPCSWQDVTVLPCRINKASLESTSHVV